MLNLISGRLDELLTPLCGHRDVNAIVDATGDDDVAERSTRSPPRPSELGERLDVLAAETVKRVVRIPAGSDPVADALRRLEGLTELKTAWHPIGA